MCVCVYNYSKSNQSEPERCINISNDKLLTQTPSRTGGRGGATAEGGGGGAMGGGSWVALGCS